MLLHAPLCPPFRLDTISGHPHFHYTAALLLRACASGWYISCLCLLTAASLLLVSCKTLVYVCAFVTVTDLRREPAVAVGACGKKC